MSKDIQLRGSTYYLRFRVPARFKAVPGRTEIKESLKTSSITEAERRAAAREAELLAFWAGGGETQPDRSIQEPVDELVRMALAERLESGDVSDGYSAILDGLIDPYDENASDEERQLYRDASASINGGRNLIRPFVQAYLDSLDVAPSTFYEYRKALTLLT